ncbi:hypothetical protein CES85_0143 [Ochrobactrum quorumnocens]|uniref:Uncharacterized protein n=1 Tax=Ochrobactrum quorumnocens TaxID=271865 RepID=A0A248UHU6_9HYPH|nr:hypothetical protein CES85_0143 [[Ochrobactrum] quorumnocens]
MQNILADKNWQCAFVNWRLKHFQQKWESVLRSEMLKNK